MKKRTIFYRKEGRKYIPVAENANELFEAVPYGAHLLIIEQHGGHRRYNIDPNFASLEAAAIYLEDKLVRLLVEASGAKASSTPLTDEQRAAWEDLNKAFGNSISLIHPAAADIARSFMYSLQEVAKAVNSNPTVRTAYEQYLMAVELTRDN